MYKLVNIATGETVTTSETKVQFGGPWGALDSEGKPTHEWVEIVPTADELRRAEFDKVHAEYKPKLAKLQDALVTLQANGMNTASFKTAYAATMADYKAALLAVK